MKIQLLTIQVGAFGKDDIGAEILSGNAESEWQGKRELPRRKSFIIRLHTSLFVPWMVFCRFVSDREPCLCKLTSHYSDCWLTSVI